MPSPRDPELDLCLLCPPGTAASSVAVPLSQDLIEPRGVGENKRAPTASASRGDVVVDCLLVLRLSPAVRSRHLSDKLKRGEEEEDDEEDAEGWCGLGWVGLRW